MGRSGGRMVGWLVACMTLALTLPSLSQAAFPGANGKIAFVRAGDIWTMDPDGSGPVNLTNSAVADSNPAWSADGNRIAFDSNVGPNFNRQLFVMFADGTGVTQVGSGGYRVDPAWSPDGSQLTYILGGYPWVAKMSVDGTGETALYPIDRIAESPAWSPDAAKIAFSEETYTPANECWHDVLTMDTDGTDFFNVTACATAGSEAAFSLYPSWSPDGTRIAYVTDYDCPADCPKEIATIDPDGTDRVILQNVIASQPAWSPDGGKIAFSTGFDSFSRIKTVNADGTGIVDLTAGTQPDWQPLNQPGPEADVLAFITDAPDPVPAGGLLTYDVSAKNLVGPDDATGASLTVNLPASAFFVSASPDQGSCSEASGTVTCNIGSLPQGSSVDVRIVVEPRTQGTATVTAIVAADETDPIAGNNASQTTTTVTAGGYPRPKSANPIHASLVPAFRACSPDEAGLVHGPPLAHPSCGSPAQASGFLTVGTPDANGPAANMAGYARLSAIGEPAPIDPNNGDQADVGLQLNLTDVRDKTTLADYGGELRAETILRITDQQSTPSGFAAATSTDTTLAFDVPCTPTAATNGGAKCVISTTAEALVPSLVTERRRTIWELGRVRVFDGGADGDTATGPDTLFAVQGIFVP